MGRRGARVGAAGFLSAVLLALVPITSAAADDGSGFVRGEASSTADTVGLNAQLGNVTVGYTLGRTIADYQESEGNAEGRALDLEALPTLIGETAACPGVVPQLPNASLPPVTSVDSGQAGAAGSHLTQAFFPELQKGVSTLPAGTQDASATPQPSSVASTSTPTQDLGLISVWNGRATSRTQLVGRTREATSTIEADHIGLFGNAIVLDHPKWTATAHSGDQTDVTGTFTVDSGRAFGVDRTASQIKGDLSWVAGAASQIFSIVGLHLDLPKVVVDGTRVSVTPLTFRLTNMPLGSQLVGPLLDLFTTQIQSYYDQLRASGCQGESTAQLTALVQGVLSGHGTVAIPLGGVSATTDDTDFPALDIPPPPADDADAVADTGASAPPAAVADTSAPAPPDTSTGSVPADASTTLDTVPTDALPISPIVDTSPTSQGGSDQGRADGPRTRSKGGDTGGAAALVGALGVLAAIGLAVADRFSIIRGKRRVIPS